MADKNIEFSKRLKQLLDRRGWNVSDLARAIGKKSGTVNPYVKSGRVPEWAILVAIAETLSVSMEWLLTGKEGDSAPAREDIRVGVPELTGQLVENAIAELGGLRDEVAALARRLDSQTENTLEMTKQFEKALANTRRIMWSYLATVEEALKKIDTRTSKLEDWQTKVPIELGERFRHFSEEISMIEAKQHTNVNLFVSMVQHFIDTLRMLHPAGPAKAAIGSLENAFKDVSSRAWGSRKQKSGPH